jgi:hypothetical protein
VASQLRVAHQVSQRFNQPNAKYSGETNESRAAKFQIYRTVTRDFQLSGSQKVDLVHHLFDDDAQRYYNNNVKNKSSTVEEVYDRMYKEFKSLTSQDLVKNQLRVLMFHSIIEAKNMTRTEALDYIKENINGVNVRCEHKLHFSCGDLDHILPCSKSTDLQPAAIQKRATTRSTRRRSSMSSWCRLRTLPGTRIPPRHPPTTSS